MHCTIFANGDFSLSPAMDPPWRQTDLVIATDGGARHCHLLRLIPDLLVGDMDSIPPWLLAHLAEQGSEILRFSCRKDKTDLELAIDLAVERGAKSILILGALGGRWDMSLAAVMLLAFPTYADIDITLQDGPTVISRLHGGGHLVIQGHPGDTLSLIPLVGPARGVSLSGLDYPLTEQDIPIGSTLGISNILTRSQARINLREGLLLCIVCHNGNGLPDGSG